MQERFVGRGESLNIIFVLIFSHQSSADNYSTPTGVWQLGSSSDLPEGVTVSAIADISGITLSPGSPQVDSRDAEVEGYLCLADGEQNGTHIVDTQYSLAARAQSSWVYGRKTRMRSLQLGVVYISLRIHAVWHAGGGADFASDPHDEGYL
jgi:hypothetical protein